jgi:hypothetical protein
MSCNKTKNTQMIHEHKKICDLLRKKHSRFAVTSEQTMVIVKFFIILSLP